MAKREPGVGQVGAKNTKTFFPAARPRPGQRKNKRHYGPCHRPKRKTPKKIKPRHGASWPHKPPHNPQRTTQHAGTPKQLQTRRGGKTRKLWEATCSSVCVS